jgi:Tfp pilus assembly protein PilV
MGRLRTLRGTSLLELLIAIVVLALFIPVLFNAISGMGRNSQFSRNRAIALDLAREEIDGQVAKAHSGTLVAEGVSTPRTDQDVPITFTVSRTNTQATISSQNDVYKVHVTVNWTNQNGQADSLSLELWIKDGDQ